jgi:hypothetical protein
LTFDINGLVSWSRRNRIAGIRISESSSFNKRSSGSVGDDNKASGKWGDGGSGIELYWRGGDEISKWGRTSMAANSSSDWQRPDEDSELVLAGSLETGGQVLDIGSRMDESDRKTVDVWFDPALLNDVIEEEWVVYAEKTGR